MNKPEAFATGSGIGIVFATLVILAGWPWAFLFFGIFLLLIGIVGGIE